MKQLFHFLHVDDECTIVVDYGFYVYKNTLNP